MKAWLVRERDGEYATVVFAETRGKARSLAMATDACADADFCDIEVTRKPQLDKYYTDGKKEMDWYEVKDRIALVKDGGFRCASECECEMEDMTPRDRVSIYHHAGDEIIRNLHMIAQGEFQK